jgi:putative ABC transport system substrate-binding protein
VDAGPSPLSYAQAGIEAQETVERPNRRRFVAGLAAVAVSTSGITLLSGCDRLPGQAPRKVPVIGFLNPGTREQSFEGDPLQAFRQALREQGLVEDRDVLIEYRFADGRPERLPALAAELVGLGVQLIVTGGPNPTGAARQVTDRVPIVMVNGTDPVAAGWAVSLARPGGNVTGASADGAQGAKSIELLAAVAPTARRLAHLTNLSAPGADVLAAAVVTAAEQLRLQLLVLDLRSHAEIDPAFEQARAWGVDAAFIRNLPPMNSPTLTPVLTHVAENRLPAISAHRRWVDAGLLMMLQASLREQGRMGASYVARILKGADPAELPIYRPTEFELLVNSTTLAHLGLTMPPDVAVQVTEWVT